MSSLTVSISESRCFSFQVYQFMTGSRTCKLRDKRFNLGIEMLFVSSDITQPQPCACKLHVSISESRCFSFQDLSSRLWIEGTNRCFNLGIEMLFVSSFSSKRCVRGWTNGICFNLGIEMLFVSRITAFEVGPSIAI